MYLSVLIFGICLCFSAMERKEAGDVCSVMCHHCTHCTKCHVAWPAPPPVLKPLFGGIPKSSLVIHAEQGFSKVAWPMIMSQTKFRGFSFSLASGPRPKCRRPMAKCESAPLPPSFSVFLGQLQSKDHKGLGEIWPPPPQCALISRRLLRRGVKVAN